MLSADKKLEVASIEQSCVMISFVQKQQILVFHLFKKIDVSLPYIIYLFIPQVAMCTLRRFKRIMQGMKTVSSAIHFTLQENHTANHSS